MAAKLLPAYIEYFAVKKMFAAMEQAGDLKGTVRDIRKTFDKRNAIEDVKTVKGDDLEITQGRRRDRGHRRTGRCSVPMVYNVSACLDFTATTAK